MGVAKMRSVSSRHENKIFQNSPATTRETPLSIGNSSLIRQSLKLSI
jgi:hypothetical protein